MSLIKVSKPKGAKTFKKPSKPSRSHINVYKNSVSFIVCVLTSESILPVFELSRTPMALEAYTSAKT